MTHVANKFMSRERHNYRELTLYVTLHHSAVLCCAVLNCVRLSLFTGISPTHSHSHPFSPSCPPPSFSLSPSTQSFPPILFPSSYPILSDPPLPLPCSPPLLSHHCRVASIPYYASDGKWLSALEEEILKLRATLLADLKEHRYLSPLPFFHLSALLFSCIIESYSVLLLLCL